MPIRDIFVGYSGGNIKHDDPTLSLDVVAISESTKLLLSGCIPHVETDGTSVGVENQWVYFHTQSGYISLLKLASEMSFDKRRLPSSTIPNEDQFKGSDGFLFLPRLDRKSVV